MRYWLIASLLIICLPVIGAEVLLVTDDEGRFIVSDHLQLYEDVSSQMGFDEAVKLSRSGKFIQPDKNFLNFGLTKSTYWLNFKIENGNNTPCRYFLQINNFDIDKLEVFELVNDSLVREDVTGEMYPASTRDVFDPRFVFSLHLEPRDVHELFIAASTNGHALYIPVQLFSEDEYEKTEFASETINWLIYGILFFIFFFNLYMYRTTQTLSVLFYSLYVLFATTVLLIYDGYIFLINSIPFLDRLKWYSPALYGVFLLLFVHSFVFGDPVDGHRSKKVMLPILVLLVVPLMGFLPYPYNLAVDIIIPFIVLLLQVGVIVVAYFAIRTGDAPSRMFFYAYIIIFIGFFMHELKEVGVLPVNLFFTNVLKTSFLLESIILTFVVLERNRLDLIFARKTVEHSLQQIEIQNKELELINSELEKLSLIASETKNSVAICDVNGRIDWCNKGFSKFYDVTLDELIASGEDTLDKVIPNEKLLTHLRTCVEKSRVIIFETLAKTKRRKEIWVQTTLTPYSINQKVKKIIAIDSDITNLKNYERRLEHAKNHAEKADKLKTAFLSNMSHEIRTPLNGILGFTELLQLNAEVPEKRKKYLGIIRSNSEQLMKIIEDILDISMIESEQMKFNLTQFHLHGLLYQIYESFKVSHQHLFKEDFCFEFENQLPKDVPPISSDQYRLTQITENLLRNALKFTTQGYVKLGCRLAGENIEVYVEDTGQGVEETISEYIFTQFRQGDERLKRNFGGTGLGLAISKGLIELLGGTIWLDKSYNEGARFIFSVPLKYTVPVPMD